MSYLEVGQCRSFLHPRDHQSVEVGSFSQSKKVYLCHGFCGEGATGLAVGGVGLTFNTK